MTEAEWLACADPTPMLGLLRGKASERKLRLFAVACCRQCPDVFDDPRLEAAVEVAERFADGLATEAERAAAEAGVLALLDEREEEDEFESRGHVAAALWVVQRSFTSDTASACAARAAQEAAAEHGGHPRVLNIEAALSADQADLLREVVRYRPPAFDRLWVTSTASLLAGVTYFRRAFDRLPILADALEEAGCDEPHLLAHCRGPGPHVRGCWAVDLILGKG